MDLKKHGDVFGSHATEGSSDLRSDGVLEVHLPLAESEAAEDERQIDIAD